MKKRTKKLASILTALAMLTSLSAAVWADTAIGSGSATTDQDTSNVLTIPKSINVTNPENIKVYSPAITYSYTIAPATVPAGTTVTDSNGHVGTVRQGIAGAVTLANNGDLTFASTEVTANTADDEITGNITLTFDPTNAALVQQGPGIYRYKITDVTTDETLHSAGIERSTDYDAVRYLDVYVIRVVDAQTGAESLKIAGYALFNGNVLYPDGDQTSAADASVDSNTTKSSGYVSGSEPPKQGDPDTGSDGATLTDTYDTYNVEITKKVTGDMGDKNHAFSFAYTVNNNGTNASYYAGKDKNANGNVAVTASTETSFTGTLKDSETFYIQGLSPNATFAVAEKNNTNDSYTLTVKGDNDAAVNDDAATPAVISGTPINPGSAIKTELINVSTYDTATDYHGVSAVVDKDVLTFTNNLDAVSPTGVIIRSLPYVAMVVIAGAMLVAIKMINKSEKKEENKNEAN